MQQRHRKVKAKISAHSVCKVPEKRIEIRENTGIFVYSHPNTSQAVPAMQIVAIQSPSAIQLLCRRMDTSNASLFYFFFHLPPRAKPRALASALIWPLTILHCVDHAIDLHGVDNPFFLPHFDPST
ncbi:hypothetical protein K457DRAFT_1575624 [Linnemannia elongata AG-77]|uniref:Uncharacterized protein n=1 Tax=Linnemannia elongata AG-77 TaxID=1314771 RepID=A0A197JP19_9FUNG|nr:hypothetical protein K457DRAFT_1575624 [Linnemannia elongata AG-77]